MRLAIMQPYFFPYLGYYSLIKKTDKFILFDTVQYIRHGWIERNRILKPAEGWQYVAVPLEKKSFGTLIHELTIKNTEDWKEKLFRQLEHYRKRAPFYRETVRVIEDSLRINTNSIVMLNENILKTTCQYFQIPLNISIYSGMNLTVGEVTHPGEWALQISKAHNAKEYLNPIGGMEIFRPDQFADAGIELRFLENNLKPYSQRRPIFEAGLSIIDVMMFNNIESIVTLIDDVTVLPHEASVSR